MIRWLSQLWVSTAVDRNDRPSKLWRWTFGRFTSHRKFASQLHQIDSELKHQAAYQRRAVARQPLPVGRYAPRLDRDKAKPDKGEAGSFSVGGGSLLRPTLTMGSFAVVVAVIWLAWPSSPAKRTPQELGAMTAHASVQTWEPLTRQAKMIGRTLHGRTSQIGQLPKKLLTIDEVVNDLGEAIQSPIRDEVRRFANDLRQPWTYLANQLPRPRLSPTPNPAHHTTDTSTHLTVS